MNDRNGNEVERTGGNGRSSGQIIIGILFLAFGLLLLVVALLRLLGLVSTFDTADGLKLAFSCVVTFAFFYFSWRSFRNGHRRIFRR